MTISKEAIEAARSEINESFMTEYWGAFVPHQAVERALTAALPFLVPIAGEGKVKALEWVKHPAAEAWRADTMLGTYQVWVGSLATGWQFDGFIGERINEKSTDAVFAKATAQADYETRILSALADGGQQADWVFEAIRASYERGAMWRHENGTLELVEKASYDFADKRTAPSSPGKDGGQEVAAVAWRRERDGWLNEQGLGVPLYTRPLHQITVDADVVIEAATAVLKSWDDAMGGEVEEIRTYDRGGLSHEYWSPARSTVASEHMAKLRAALAKSPSSDRAASEIIANFVQCHDDGTGLLDCIDNKGGRYTSKHLDDTVRAARSFLAEAKGSGQ